jgi:hypothetical protein
MNRICNPVLVGICIALVIVIGTVRSHDPLAKLNAAPGENGLPPDPEDQAAVDAINDMVSNGPEEGQSQEAFMNELRELQSQLYDYGTGSACDVYAPPAVGECRLVGDAATCPGPCVDMQPASCSLEQLPFAAADGLYDLVYEVDDRTEPVDREALDLVQYAWAVLLDNLDLVEWTACLWYGESDRDSSVWENLGEVFGVAGSVAECLSEKVQGQAPDVTIRFTQQLGEGAFWTRANAINGGTIFIPLNGSRWNDSYLSEFKAATSGSAEQFCIAADLAATLLHELVHSCMTGGTADVTADGDAKNSCTSSYLIENSFRWALGQRYPCLGATTNCSYYTDPRLGNNDGAAYPGEPPF